MNNKSDCHRILSARKIGIVLPEAIMRCPVQLSVMALVLLASPIAWAQRDGHVLSGSSIARFSYTNTWPLDNKDDESSQICFAVQQDGHYQMRRLTAKGATELVGGTVPAVELKKLEKLLEAPEFRGLTSSVGGVIFNGGESFATELSSENGVQRLFLANPDGERPFPASASKIINWLQNFKPRDAEALDVNDPDICPGAAMKLVRPSVASLAPASK